MTVFSISSLETNTLVTDPVMYNEDFVLFYEETFVTKELHDILTHSYIENITTDRLPLHPKKRATYDEIIAEVTDINETDAIELLEAEYTDDVHFTVIAHDIFVYNELLTFVTNLVYHAKKHKKLLENEIQDFIYASLVPKIQKNPHLYIAIGEFGVLHTDGKSVISKEKDEPNPDLMLRRLLFSLACLFLDGTHTVTGIDSCVKTSTSAFLSDIGKITILEKLSKFNTKTNIDFSDEKLQLLIPKFSGDFLQRHLFSNEIVDAVKSVYSFIPKDVKAVPTLRNKEARYQFIAICNTYASLIYQGTTPPAALQSIINTSVLYDLNIIKKFVETISIVPIGSYVKLQNNAIGFVYRKNDEFPKDPIVQLITNSDGTVQHQISYVQTNEEKFNIVSFVPETDIPNYKYLRLTLLSNFLN